MAVDSDNRTPRAFIENSLEQLKMTLEANFKATAQVTHQVWHLPKRFCSPPALTGTSSSQKMGTSMSYRVEQPSATSSTNIMAWQTWAECRAGKRLRPQINKTDAVWESRADMGIILIFYSLQGQFDLIFYKFSQRYLNPCRKCITIWMRFSNKECCELTPKLMFC